MRASIESIDPLSPSATNALWRLALDRAHVFVGLLDLDGILRDANAAPMSLLREAAAEVLGRPFWEISWWSHDRAQQARLREAIFQAAAGTEVRFDATHQATDGATLLVDFRLHPVRDGNGRIVALLAEGSDVTQWRRADEALLASTALYRGLVESQSDFITRLNLEGRIVFANPAMVDTLGLPAEQVIGRKWQDFIHPEDQPAVAAALAQAARPPLFRARVEGRLLHPGGDCWVSWEGGAIRDPGGALVETQAVGRDITEARQSRERLQNLVRDLDSSNRELEQFAYVASHDLREPLRMVSSYMALMERRLADKLDDDTREFLHFARDGARRMDALILDLLAYSRIGRVSQPMGPVPLDKVVGEVLLDLQLAIDQAGASVSVAADLPVILGEEHELARLFSNFLANAVKYRHPDRPGRIAVGWDPVAPGTVEVWVADNGIGIEPEFFDRIFLIFQRLGRREEADGTGIGLAVCKKIAEHHGGRIRVESTPGEGSRFIVTLGAYSAPPPPPN